MQCARLVADLILVVGEHEKELVPAAVGWIIGEDRLVERERFLSITVALRGINLRLNAGRCRFVLARCQPCRVALVVVAHFLQRHGLRLLPPQLRELEVHVRLARSFVDLVKDALELRGHLVALLVDVRLAARLLGVCRHMRGGDAAVASRRAGACVLAP